jgi:ketosteroid isomerase-like protein
VLVADRLESFRELFPVYNEQGVEAVLHMFDPDVAWMAPPEWMDAPVYCGHDGLRDLDGLWRANFDDYWLDPEEIRELGDSVVVLLHMHGTIKGTTQKINQRAAWVVDFSDDGLVSQCSAYFSWEEALEAAAART